MAKLAYTVPNGEGSPAWSSADHTTLDIDVFFPHLGETVRFTAAKADPGWEHSEEIFARAKAGEFGEIAEYVAPPPKIPQVISDRQFAQGLAIRKLIREDEAIAWVSSGKVPAEIATYVDTLPEDQRFGAKMLLSGATKYQRSSPLMAVFGKQTGMSEAEIDQFWLECAAL